MVFTLIRVLAYVRKKTRCQTVLSQFVFSSAIGALTTAVVASCIESVSATAMIWCVLGALAAMLITGICTMLSPWSAELAENR